MKCIAKYCLCLCLMAQSYRMHAQCLRCSDNISINSGLILCHPFNGNANDESGNGYNGTVYGASLTADRYNRPNKAYSFRAADTNYILLAKNLPDFTTASVSVW